jgi:hypothetical protein
MVVHQMAVSVQVKFLQGWCNLTYDQYTWINAVRFCQADDVARQTLDERTSYADGFEVIEAAVGRRYMCLRLPQLTDGLCFILHG